MKNFIFIALLFVATLGVAQGVKTTTVQIDGNETETVDIYNTSGYAGLSIQTVATEVGGTTDGTITLQVSNDGSNFSSLTDALLIGAHDAGITFLSDSIHTMTDGSVWWVFIDNPNAYIYRLSIAGTANDTTSVAATYKFNK